MEYLWWLDGWLTEWISDLMTQRLTQPNLAYASKKLICIWRFYHLRIIFSRATRPQGQSLVIFAFGKNWLKLLSSVTKRSVTVVQLDTLCAVKIQSPNKKLDYALDVFISYFAFHPDIVRVQVAWLYITWLHKIIIMKKHHIDKTLFFYEVHNHHVKRKCTLHLIGC